MDKAKNEVKDVTTSVKESVNDRGDDNRNFFGKLREVRLSETVENIAGERLKVASTQNEIKSAFEEAYSDLGYKAEIKFSTPEETPELKDKAGTAYVSSTGVHTMIININAKENSTKSGLIGTIAEEGSHIINGVEGRQIETGTDEKGLESTGRATNEYFKDKYKDDKTVVSMKSDGAIDISKLGVHVGDRIFLDSSLTYAERKVLFKNVQDITDKKLTIKESGCTGVGENKKCTTYEVVYVKNKKGEIQKKDKVDEISGENNIFCLNDECTYGNKLMKSLIDSKDKIAITNQRDPNNWFGVKKVDEDGKKIEKGSSAKTIRDFNGKIIPLNNYDHFTLLNTNKIVRVNTVKLNNKGEGVSINPEEMPSYVVLAHELIHNQHELSDAKNKIDNSKFITSNGRVLSTSYIKFKGRDYTDTWLDKDGKKLEEGGDKSSLNYGDVEEYRTVGTGFKNKPIGETIFSVKGDFNVEGDITENMIRQDHGLNFRANYDGNKIFYNLTEKEEKEKIEKAIREMERGK